MKCKIVLCGPVCLDRVILKTLLGSTIAYFPAIGEAKIFLRGMWKYVSLEYGKLPGDGLTPDKKFLRFGMCGAEIVEDI